MVLKDYQEVAMQYLWSLDKGASSCEIWVATNKNLRDKTISRASIINFLNAMVDEGVLNYTEITGKGGHRRIYSPKYDASGFKQWIAETVLKNLLRDFPDETKKVMISLTPNKKSGYYICANCGMSIEPGHKHTRAECKLYRDDPTSPKIRPPHYHDPFTRIPSMG